MADQDQHLKLRNTPGGVITASAFTYAVKFYDYAYVKFPELKQYTDYRSTLHQSAIVVATLIMMERHTKGEGARDLHENVSKAFPAPARHRCLTAIQELSAVLLNADRAFFGPEHIPSYADLAGADDKKLQKQIGEWLASSLTKKPALEPADLPLAAKMGSSAWTSAIMIVRVLQGKNKR